jgi:oligoendopeptidase F
MPTLAKFELEVHNRIENGKGVSVEDLVHLYADLMVPAYGDDVVYDKEGVGVEWASFLHLYSPFYTFKYTVGIAASYAIAARFLDGDPNVASDYLRFLQAGSSVYPLEALKLAGVDIADLSLIEAAFSAMSVTLDELEDLL